MRELKVTRVNLRPEEINIREMSEIELVGAMTYIELVCNNNDYTEPYSLDEVDTFSIYSKKRLELLHAFFTEDEDDNIIVLDSVFMIEGNNAEIFGYAYNMNDTDQELFLIRI